MKVHSTYMGLNLDSPIVVSACTLSEQTENIVKMEDHGAGAVVLFSLFEEKFGLRIISWEIHADTHTLWSSIVVEVVILVNHEPKEKAKVAHLFEPPFEPDVRLY